jgi:hypothetical protein
MLLAHPIEQIHLCGTTCAHRVSPGDRTRPHEPVARGVARKATHRRPRTRILSVSLGQFSHLKPASNAVVADRWRLRLRPLIPSAIYETRWPRVQKTAPPPIGLCFSESPPPHTAEGWQSNPCPAFFYLVSSVVLSEGVPASLLMTETRWPGDTLNSVSSSPAGMFLWSS